MRMRCGQILREALRSAAGSEPAVNLLRCLEQGKKRPKKAPKAKKAKAAPTKAPRASPVKDMLPGLERNGRQLRIKKP